MRNAENAAGQFFLPLPTPLAGVRVLRRAQVLACLVCRADLERGAGHIEAEAAQRKMLAWITASNLWDEMEPDEEGTVRAALGALNDAKVIRTTWLVEGLAILSWAVYRFELPSHDVQVDLFHAAESVDFLVEGSDEPNHAVPRSPAELSAYRELIYAVHSRLRDYERHREPKNFASWIEPSWVNLLGIDVSDLMLNGDLVIDGKPLNCASESRIKECLWVSFQRHKAIIWLVENPLAYSQVSPDI